jgi:hypothetical protein
MEPHERSLDSFDQLIGETLQERMGPPPTDEIWNRVARELSEPVAPARWRRWFGSLQDLLHAPLVQTAMVLSLLLVLVVHPARYWMEDSGAANSTTPSYSVRSPGPNSIKELALPKGEPDSSLRWGISSLTTSYAPPDATPGRVGTTVRPE